jgi:GntR family transcriptional regulator
MPAAIAQHTPAFRPLYLQLRDLLLRDMETRQWRPGEALPSEIELAARFGVSQGTVRKAIDALAADNLVVRRQGKGTFVATHTEEKTSTFRFLRIRRSDGRDEYPASRLLDVRRGKASAEVARLLELKASEAVFVVRRVLEYGGEPAVLDDITPPCDAVQGADAGPARSVSAARCTDSSKHSSACACCGRRKIRRRSPPTAPLRQSEGSHR